MKIIVYVPGMPFDGDTLKAGKSLGGSETMGLMVSQELARRGNRVICFCNTDKPKFIDRVEYLPIGPADQTAPYGINFERYAAEIPHDVLLAQRAAGVFQKKYNSKLNYFWTHDLALKRHSGAMASMLWNTDRILAVSDWHKKQISEIYGLTDDFVSVLRNGIDLKSFKSEDAEIKFKSKTLLYTSRPERGLENLVKPGGIMEKLYEIDPEIQLVVAGYDNTTEQMAPLYNELWRRCEELPNVKNYGSLGKAQLYELMGRAALHVYPTEFEETSCITMMEEQASGTPVIVTPVGALPETLLDGGQWSGDLLGFVERIAEILKDFGSWEALHRAALEKSKSYRIESVIDDLESFILDDFTKLSKNQRAVEAELIRNSDLVAVRKLTGTAPNVDAPTFSQSTKESEPFYEKIAGYNVDIGNNHSLGDYDAILSMPRLQPVIDQLADLSAGSKVLDYGCCVGQVTIALAYRFPDLKFVGVDISKRQIEIGNKFIFDKKLPYVKLMNSPDINHPKIDNDFDAVIALEILEHIHDYSGFLTGLLKHLKLGAPVILSTPAGPVEAFRNEKDHPLEHLHHFEEQDILDIIENQDGFNIVYIGDHDSEVGDKLGNFVWWWKRGQKKLGKINYNKKLFTQNPTQTVSCCMIVSGDTGSLKRTLDSIPFATEFIIGVDGTEDSEAFRVAHQYGADVFCLSGSPRKIGFDAARNETLEKATCDWILWIDDDEVLQWPERLSKYFRNNQFDSYSIAQHHFSAEPAGLLKTDLPARIFRNGKGIKFYGVVHEHPEIEINKGPGKTFVIPSNEVAICHNGYDTEITRRERFQRNFPLMEREIEKHPDRLLSRFLWIRDLAHLNKFEYERFGHLTPEIEKRAKEAVEMWRGLLENAPIRIIVDSIPYVSESVDILTRGGGYLFNFCLDMSYRGFGDLVDGKSNGQIITGKLETKEDLLSLMGKFVSEKTKPFEENEKYL